MELAYLGYTRVEGSDNTWRAYTGCDNWPGTTSQEFTATHVGVSAGHAKYFRSACTKCAANSLPCPTSGWRTWDAFGMEIAWTSNTEPASGSTSVTIGGYPHAASNSAARSDGGNDLYSPETTEDEPPSKRARHLPVAFPESQGMWQYREFDHDNEVEHLLNDAAQEIRSRFVVPTHLSPEEADRWLEATPQPTLSSEERLALYLLDRRMS